jgi:RHS repeat-associated protein
VGRGGQSHRAGQSAQPSPKRLVQRRRDAASWNFGYLPNEDRLWKQDAAAKTWYAYLDEGLVGLKDESGITWLVVTVPGTDWPLALCGSNGRTYFIVADRLGSTRRVIDSAGKPVASLDFEPFGRIENIKGLAPVAFFAGMLIDDTGLYYARQRYYDQALGRFISIDPELGVPQFPASHNPYAYAMNNPLRYRDPSGGGFREEIEIEGYFYPNLLNKSGNPVLDEFGKPVINFAVPPLPVPNNAFDMLTSAEKEAVRTAYDGAQNARRILQNPTSSFNEVKAAGEALAESQRAMAKLNQIGRLRYGHALTRWTQQVMPGENAPRMMREYEQKLRALGVDPMEPYARNAPGGVNRTAFERGNPTQQVRLPENARTGQGPRPPVEAGLEGGAGKAAGEATVEEAESMGSRLWRGARWLGRGARTVLRWLRIADEIKTSGEAIKVVAEYNYEFTRMTLASRDANDATALANQMRRALEEKIRELLQKDPSKILPLSDGRKPDPNNPEDIDQLIIQLHSNLSNNRKPFEGIVASGPTPEMQEALAAALAKARELLDRGHRLEIETGSAEATFTEQKNEAQSKLQEALTQAGIRATLGADLAGVPVAADDLKKQTGAVQGQTQSMQNAQGEITAAIAKCEAAATKVCDYAQQSAGAPPDQVNLWKAEATSLVFETSNALNAAQEKIDATNIATDALRTSINALQGYQSTLAAMQFGDNVAQSAGTNVTDALAAAKAAVQAAEQARAKVTASLTELRSIGPQVRAVLQPVAWSADVAVLQAQADALGSGVDEPPVLDLNRLLSMAMPEIDAFLQNQKRVEQMILSTDIGVLLQGATAALVAADTTRSSTQALVGPERYQALQRASQCITEIKTAVPAVAANSLNNDDQGGGSPAPAVASDEVTVPNLAVFDSVSKMKVVLQHAGLTGAFVAASDPPASKDQEFKWASQDPPPDTKVQRGSTVTIAIYQKFGGPELQDVVPNVVGLTLEQAKQKLDTAGLKVGGMETSSKAPSAEKANLIYAQKPAAGEKIADDKYVSVRQYGPFKERPKPADEPEQANLPPPPSGSADELIGTWVGTSTIVSGPRYVGQQSSQSIRIIAKDGNPWVKDWEERQWTQHSEGARLIGEFTATTGVPIRNRQMLQLDGGKLIGEEVDTLLDTKEVFRRRLVFERMK